MRMRAAINELTSGGTQTAEYDDDEAEEEEEEEEEDEAAAEEAALVAQLQQKRNELQKMQAAIARLEAAEQEAEAAAEEEEEEEEEPQSEQEWLMRLMKQQQELQQLRSAIAAAKDGAAGAIGDEAPDLSAIDEADEEEEEEEPELDEEEEAEMREMLHKLNAKREELDQLMQMKAQLQARLEEQVDISEPAPAPSPPRPKTAPAAPTTPAGEAELRAVLQHRMEAQQAVDEQEKKIAHLTALQADLRAKLAAMEEAEGDEDEVEEEYEEEEEEEEEEAPAAADDGLPERVLELLAIKTDECQQLASVVEEARAAGMDPSNPRLQLAEHNLATRYQEIKELAAFAHRLGLTMDEEEDEEEEEEEEEEPVDSDSDAAFAKVQRLQQELNQCVEELRSVDANASPAVAKNPAFLKMRAMVVSKLEALHSELTEAREAYDRMGKSKALVVQQQQQVQDDGQEEVDLSPMLRAALDKLWQRPYDCRIFTLQLLQSLAQLDNASLCMMTSCFARYLENHSVPA